LFAAFIAAALKVRRARGRSSAVKKPARKGRKA
jgi:hypothetical protein